MTVSMSNYTRDKNPANSLSKNSALFFISSYFLMFTTGLAVLSTGAILPEIVKEFAIGYDLAGILLSLQAIGNMAAVIISGSALDFIGGKIVLLTGSLFLVISFAGIAYTSSAIILYFLIFISGCGWGINNIISSIMNNVTGGSAKHLNRVHVFFAAGAFTAPFFVIFSDAIGMGWRFVSGTISILSLCSVILIIIIKIPAAQIEHKSHKEKQANKIKVSFEAFKHARYYIFLAVSFTYAAVEAIMNGWITTYFQNTGVLTNTEAKIALSLIWISIMTGRIIISIVGDKIKKEYIILSCAFIILIFTSVLMQLSTFLSLAVCVFILGLGLSALLPTNLANSAVVINGSSMAMGILISTGGLGATVGPLITGMAAEQLNLSASMWVAVGFAVILLSTAILNYLFCKKSNTVNHR